MGDAGLRQHLPGRLDGPLDFSGAPPQRPCYITYLEEPGKRIIADNIGKSAMYGGAIASRGPRYCPSVED
ncbi:MAG TPA: FAD-dependent oxidoreductase, partial [Ramlibacter sp.]|nr:FAD-dependent oxidoreductase [Ramlibacter sp.]